MSRAMLLTGSGTAAIAVIRIQGEGVENFLTECFDRPMREGVCVYGRILDDKRVIDDAVIVKNADHADLNIHGGIWIVHEVQELLRRKGFKVVPWTPEEMWAVEGGTLIEREIAAYLPLAQSELAIRILLNQKQAWEGIGGRSIEQLSEMLRDRTLNFLLHPPSVAIVGLPNVGKSTLANQLFGQERSITADMPGTTRDWVEELANIDGLVVKLIDTPGQRQSEDEIEMRAIAAAGAAINSAQLVIVVIDPTQDAEEQRALLGRWPGAMVVVNKSDLGEWVGEAVRTIASRGIGIDQVRQEIRRHFGMEDVDENFPRCWTDRQREEISGLLQCQV